MSKLLWIDPPSGYLYGFPKVWDSNEGTIREFLKANGYPLEDTEELQWVRCWIAEEEDAS